MDPTPEPNLEDYSASSTLTTFPEPLHLIRGPVPSDPPDDEPYVLAFNSPKSWETARAASRASVLRQCHSGAQIGCAIAASRNCKPPWWRSLLGAKIDPEEREICEARETEICVVASNERCVGFANEKCLGAFRDARIAAGEERVTPREAARLICWASMPEKSFGSDSIGNLGSVCVRVSRDRELGAASYRASDLMGSDDNIEMFLD